MKKILLLINALLLITVPLWAGITPAFRQKIQESSAGQPVSAIVWMKGSISNTLSKKGVLKPAAANYKTIAAQSQRLLLNTLASAKQTGEVIDYQSFWLVNAVKITASGRYFEQLAARDDIRKIDVDWKIRVPEPATNDTAAVGRILPSAVQSNLTQIHVDDIWNNYRVDGTQLLGSGINVAVLDTGIDYNHPLLTGNIVAQFDFAENDADAFDDASGHGTHVAGIIAARDGIGIAPSVNLLIGRVFDDNEEGLISYLVSATQWAISNGARIINMSLGEEEAGANDDMRTIIDSIHNMGVVPVSSIGNFGPSTFTTTSPGNCPNAIGVGAVDSGNDIASFSSRGPIVWDSITYTKPDIVAPGVNIYSTNPSYNNNYKTESGTSQACPHIVGVIALMLQANSTLGNTGIKQILENTADDLGYTGEDNNYGAGVINAYDALVMTDETLPQVSHTAITRANADSDIMVTVNIADNVSLVSGPWVYGTVYYRYTGHGWGAIPLIKETTTNYYTSIPKSVGAFQVEYYLAVRDLNPNNTVRIPNTGTYTVILRDDEAPAIIHNAVIYYALNRDITITANILDTIDSSPAASIYFRENDSGQWQTVAMTAIGDDYTAAIPGTSASDTTVNYYIKAWDTDDNISYSPTGAPTVSYSVIEDNITPSVSFSLMNGDYIPGGIITFQAFDNSALSSVLVTVNGTELAGQYIDISGNDIQIDLSSYSAGTYIIEIAITDMNNNITRLSSVCVAIASSTKSLRIMGPTNADARPLNCPNPFDPSSESTVLSFRVTEAADIEVAIFDLSLQRIKTITDVVRNPGLYYEVTWDGKNDDGDSVLNGVYFYVLKAASQTGSDSHMIKGKMVVLR
ncbi:S8 family serine peptidase [Candidatus Margulisiibacteriota bacterium]